MGDFEPQVSTPEPAREPTPEEIAANEEQHKRRVAGYIQLLKDKNLNFRWRAAEALGELGDPAAVEPLIEALQGPVCRRPVARCKIPGKIGDLRAVAHLLEALKSEDKWLRIGAAWGLGKLRDPRAVEPLILLLKDTKKMVRKNAAWALGNIADKRAIAALTESLEGY